MTGYLEAVNTMHTRGVVIDEKDYIFTLMVVLNESPQNAFALAYDMSEFKKVIGTEDEEIYLSSKKKDAQIMLGQQHIIQLKDLLEESYRAEIQKSALNLTDFKFSGQEAIQILNNLLKTRIEDLESSSVKDVVGIIKMLTEQGALDTGDGGFSKHFITIPKKYDIICPQCNVEGYAVEGLDFRCTRCGLVAKWDESQHRFFPQLNHL